MNELLDGQEGMWVGVTNQVSFEKEVTLVEQLSTNRSRNSDLGSPATPRASLRSSARVVATSFSKSGTCF